MFAIPKRSPDLSVMDYAIWKAVSRRLRRQERTFPANEVETKEKFMERLKKTARRLPSALVTLSIADLRRRCQRLHAARGGHFEEGGLRFSAVICASVHFSARASVRDARS